MNVEPETVQTLQQPKSFVCGFFFPVRRKGVNFLRDLGARGVPWPLGLFTIDQFEVTVSSRFKIINQMFYNKLRQLAPNWHIDKDNKLHVSLVEINTVLSSVDGIALLDEQNRVVFEIGTPRRSDTESIIALLRRYGKQVSQQGHVAYFIRTFRRRQVP